MTKKQKKSLFVLLGILVLLAAALLAVRAHSVAAEKKAAASSSSSTESRITASGLKFSSISYTNSTATLSFALDKDGKWYWKGDQDFPLNTDYVEKIAGTISDLTPQQTITQGDTLDAYGLTAPAVTLTAAETDGASLKLALGKATTDGKSYYLLKNDDKTKVYVVDGTLYTELTRGIYDMIQLPALPTLQESSLTSVAISGAAQTALKATVTKQSGSASASSGADSSAESGSDVSVTWHDGTGADVTGNPDMTDLVSEICGLAVDHCEDYKPSAKAVTICGFDKPRCTLSVNYTDENGEAGSFTLTVGNQTADGGSYYVRLGTDTTIYAVKADGLSKILSVAASGLAK